MRSVPPSAGAAEALRRPDARSTTIQYGGSMNAANAQDLLNQEDVDGGLIGTAALDVEQFLQIIQTANQDGPQP